VELFLIVLGLVFLLCVAGLFYSTALQRKAVGRQKQAMDMHQESVERQDRAIAIMDESIRLSRQMVEHQQRAIALLEQIRDGR